MALARSSHCRSSPRTAVPYVGSCALQCAPTARRRPPLGASSQVRDLAAALGGVAATAVGEEGGAGAAPRLGSYVAPEADAARGMLSTACRLRLRWDDAPPAPPRVDADDGSRASPPPRVAAGGGGYYDTRPRSVFYKRVVLAELPHALAKVRTSGSRPPRQSLRRDKYPQNTHSPEKLPGCRTISFVRFGDTPALYVERRA